MSNESKSNELICSDEKWYFDDIYSNWIPTIGFSSIGVYFKGVTKVFPSTFKDWLIKM